jgi:hypothetical protein
MDGYTWDEQREVERQCNLVLDKHFTMLGCTVETTGKVLDLHMGIDRLLTHPDGERRAVQYKVQNKAAYTSRMAFEQFSQERGGDIRKKGWPFHMDWTDDVVFYVHRWNKAFTLSPDEIIEQWDEIVDECNRRQGGLWETKNYKDEAKTIYNYSSWNYCADVWWLTKRGFFKQVMDTSEARRALGMDMDDDDEDFRVAADR